MQTSDSHRDYTTGSLSKSDLKNDPLEQFEVWFNQALKSDIVDPNAMCLATATKDAKPTLRTVLLKGFDNRGFIFFTNFESQKAEQIKDNPQVSILFQWLKLERQIIIHGTVSIISNAESIEYFTKRPVESQLSAWASKQSHVISSRDELEKKYENAKIKFKDNDVPLPPNWGGYIICPLTYEFWQGRKSRLHDRFRYTPQNENSWKIERLAP